MALQATFHIHVILLPIGIQKICLVPFRKHHLGWSSSWVVYCISFYRLECIIQYTLTWLKYVTEYQIVHYATLTLRRCAVFVVCFFLPLQAIIMSCIWNTQMFYTRHVYLFINTQIYSRICSAGPCRYGFRKQKKNWTCRNERCLPLSVTRVVQVLHIPSKVRTTK